MEIGGISVVGLAAGEHYLPDIQIVVPHRVQVYIPAEKALRSKDLYRALAQGTIFKLDGGTGYVQQQASASDLISSAALRQENERLNLELAMAQQQITLLKEQLKVSTALQGQMATIMAALGRIEATPKGVPQMMLQPQGSPVIADTGVVGGEVPMFLPDMTMPNTADVQLNIQQTVSEDSVTGAASTLRALRSKIKG